MKMKNKVFCRVFGMLMVLTSMLSCQQADNNPFWNGGKEFFDSQQLYTSERFPNVVVAMDGSVIATWGTSGFQVRRSEDGGITWEDLSVSDVLPDGPQHHDYGLMGGLVRLPVDGHDILLFSMVDVPAAYPGQEVSWTERTHKRERGTIWASFDGGKTWPVKRLVTEGSFAYSSLAAGRAGTPSEGLIYLLYEGRSINMEGEHLGRFDSGHLVRFNLAWVTEGRDWKEFLPQ